MTQSTSMPNRHRFFVELAILIGIGILATVALQLLGDKMPPPRPQPADTQVPAFTQSTQERVLISRFHDDRLVVRTALHELPRPITDPTDAQTVYKYQSTGYARAKTGPANQATTRFVVYSEDQPGLSDAAKVCHLMLLYWDMLSSRLGMDHALSFERTVYVFLKKNGKPGAEQKVTTGPDEKGQPLKRNSIFIYDIAHLTDPLEFCRELAHEYGHAVLPAVGGYREPEYWANGEMGERMFMRWLAHDMAFGTVKPDEVFDLPSVVLQGWVRKNVDTLTDRILSQGFSASALKGTDRAGLDEFLGLLLATDAVYGDAILARGMLLANGNTMADVYRGIGQAIDEKDAITILPPVGGDAFWAYLPGPKWKVTGASVIGTGTGGWVQMKATTAKVQATHLPP